jgi:hypothetical protein
MSTVFHNSTADSASVRLSLGVELPRTSRQISLFGPIAPTWRLVQPLLITIEYGDGSYIISDEVFAIYGIGEEMRSAVRDYVSALTEYHDVLSRYNDEPSVSLFQRLQSYLQPIRR